MKLPIDPTQDPMAATIAAKQAEQKTQDAVALKAAATPLPGPLRDAFAIVQDIPVGKWRVRPFYDMDIEVLQAADHPLYKMILSGLNGETVETKYLPRGQQGWLAAWLFTRDPDTAEQAIRDGTAAAQSKAEFSRLQIAGLVELSKAIMAQMARYSDTIISYGPSAKEGEKGSPPS